MISKYLVIVVDYIENEDVIANYFYNYIYFDYSTCHYYLLFSFTR